MFKKLNTPQALANNGIAWASLLLRITFGGLMAVLHGYSKYKNYAESSADFPDPLGVGSAFSLQLTIFSELICAFLVAVGLLTRWALLPLIITMLVAVFSIHGADPLSEKEHAILFLNAYLAIFFLGSQRFSIDALLQKS